MAVLSTAPALATVLTLVALELAANLTGRWSVALDPGFADNPITMMCDLTQDGRELTLECDDVPVVEGTLDGQAVKFVIMTGRDNLLPARFSGILEAGDTVIRGTWRLEDTTGNRIGRFRAEKK